MNKNSKIFLAGHNGLVGSAIHRKLKDYNIIVKSHKELDLCNQNDVNSFFKDNLPECVILAAAKVGGIYANKTYPANFITENIQIQTNVITNCYKYGVKKLLFLGSSCIYPRNCKQPIKEEYLLTSQLEETNKWYALAKIAGIYECNAYNKQYGCNFISAMPTNMFGENDNFNLETSHVLPAMIAKFHKAKIENASIELWGTGKIRREFLFVDDFAESCLFLMNNFDAGESIESGLINVGYGSDITIKELAELIKNIIGYSGDIIWNSNMPDGTPRKLLDSSKVNYLGWKAKTSLEEGIYKTYNWYKENYVRTIIL